MKNWNLVLLPLIVILSSCTHWNWVMKNESEVCDYCISKYITWDDSSNVMTEVVTETTYVTDTSMLELYLECDEHRNVVLKKIDSLNKSPLIETKIILKDNKMLINTYADSLTYLKDSIVVLHQRNTIVDHPAPPPIKIKVVPVWMYLVLALAILIAVAVIVGKFRKK